MLNSSDTDDDCFMNAFDTDKVCEVNDESLAVLRVVANRITVAVDICDITYIESKCRKAHIHLANELEPVVTYEKLSELLNRLPSSIIRCHGSFLVNLAHVREVAKTECKLHDGTSVPVSRSNLQNVAHKLQSYLRELQMN